MKYVIVLALGLALCACRGPQGDSGSNGAKGDIGFPGHPGLNGTDGSNGAAGSNGVDGKDGQQGAQGPPGANGQDATPVTWVQFCPGVTTYPSTYVEGGLCLNNNLYAVYSANNGFLTYLPPGSYSSNAIGSSCSFTVLPNCVIQ